MKKMLLVCDNDHYPHGAFEFIKWIQKQEPVFVKGFFFEATGTTDLVTAGYSAAVYNELLESRKETEGQNVERFINQCKSNNIRYLPVESDSLSWNKSFWQKETRYADLLLVSSEFQSSDLAPAPSQIHLQELLRWVDCPAVLVPESIHPPEYILGTYDGSPESMHAITQFCKTLPQYTTLPAKFVYIKNEDNDQVPDLRLLTEYVQTHFKDVEILKLHWDPDTLFTTWVECHRNALLIAGSFGRSALSTLFKKSFAAQMLRKKTSPVFIAR